MQEIVCKLLDKFIEEHREFTEQDFIKALDSMYVTANQVIASNEIYTALDAAVENGKLFFYKYKFRVR